MIFVYESDEISFVVVVLVSDVNPSVPSHTQSMNERVE